MPKAKMAKAKNAKRTPPDSDDTLGRLLGRLLSNDEPQRTAVSTAMPSSLRSQLVGVLMRIEAFRPTPFRLDRSSAPAFEATLLEARDIAREAWPDNENLINGVAASRYRGRTRGVAWPAGDSVVLDILEAAAVAFDENVVLILGPKVTISVVVDKTGEGLLAIAIGPRNDGHQRFPYIGFSDLLWDNWRPYSGFLIRAAIKTIHCMAVTDVARVALMASRLHDTVIELVVTPSVSGVLASTPRASVGQLSRLAIKCRKWAGCARSLDVETQLDGDERLVRSLLTTAVEYYLES